MTPEKLIKARQHLEAGDSIIQTDRQICDAPGRSFHARQMLFGTRYMQIPIMWRQLTFDLPEAETELVGGFHTEYSGFRFSLYFLAEYANMISVSALAVTLFFGGWLRPFPNVSLLGFLDFVPAVGWFSLKVFLFLYVFIWIRGTLPRFRFDQLMQYGWKVFLPIALANLMVSAGLVLLWM
mgnify:CR=1 FL=1